MAIGMGTVAAAQEADSAATDARNGGPWQRLTVGGYGEDITYIESPYSQMSITDFHNNIVSIENVYYGGIEGQRDNGSSLHSYVKALDATLDQRVADAIALALAKIDAMPAPFVQHYSEAANGEAVEACAALSEVLNEVIDAMRN